MKRILIACCLALAPAFATAQADYPTKPIRMIVPFPPGGPADLLGRAVGQGLSEAWKQPVVVENRPGAAGNLGVDLAVKSAPDGYTLVVVPVGNIAVNPTLFRALPYKQSDLAPITMLAIAENVLVVHPKVDARSMDELVALARREPGRLTYASPGAGSQAHLAGELLKLEAKIDMTHVSYKGVAPALNDLLGGQVTMMFAQVSSALPHIETGKLRAIGMASLKRSPAAPELPTIAEQGMPNFEAVSWYALMAPAGTPAAIIDRLAAETTRVLAKPDVRDRLAGLGMNAASEGPQRLAETIGRDTERWADVIRKQDIKVD